MKGKIVALRPLANGFELQAPPSVQALREMAEIRALKARLFAARRVKLAN
jgi:hypothetical protein